MPCFSFYLPSSRARVRTLIYIHAKPTRRQALNSRQAIHCACVLALRVL